MSPLAVFIVEGSTLEGGGQLLRNAVALSSLLCRSITIQNIRYNRKPSGLKNQHVAGTSFLAVRPMKLNSATTIGVLVPCRCWQVFVWPRRLVAQSLREIKSSLQPSPIIRQDHHGYQDSSPQTLEQQVLLPSSSKLLFHVFSSHHLFLRRRPIILHWLCRLPL